MRSNPIFLVDKEYLVLNEVRPNRACKNSKKDLHSVQWDQAQYFRLSGGGHQGLNGIRPNAPC